MFCQNSLLLCRFSQLTARPRGVVGMASINTFTRPWPVFTLLRLPSHHTKCVLRFAGFIRLASWDTSCGQAIPTISTNSLDGGGGGGGV
ncbi:hypothetical protein ACLKA7_004966 [Drosophila subpalustris]